VKEAAFLMPVQRIVGGIQIENDLLWYASVRLEEQLDGKLLNRFLVVRYLVIACRFPSAQLQPIERRLARYGCTIPATRRKFPRQGRHYRVVPQLVVIVEILISKRDRKYPLAHQRHNLVLDQFGSATIVKAFSKAPDEINGAIGRPQKQGASIRCDQTRVKGSDYLSPFDYSKIELFCATLCLHRGSFESVRSRWWHNYFC
jgi:hypothetical protein